MLRSVWFSLIFIVVAVVGIAQETCTTTFQNALRAALRDCQNLPAGTVCYASPTIETTLVSDDLVFAQGGDYLLPADVERISTGVDEENYGIVAINLPEREDTPINMVIFGNTELTNLSAGQYTYPAVVTDARGANIRQTPSTDSRLIQSIIAGETLQVAGRLVDSSWYLVLLDVGQSGWVLSSLVDIDVQLDDLSVIDPRDLDAPIYLPLRAFDFTTAKSDPCAGVPQNGLLVQSPVPTTFQINNLEVEIEGTVLLQAVTLDQLTVTVVDGLVSIINEDDESISVSAGESIEIAEEITANSYDYGLVEVLPLELLNETYFPVLNWQQHIIPAQERPLADIPQDGTCTVAVTQSVNLRTGPGREYPVLASLLEKQSFQPEIRAQGADGRIWWRLTPGVWLNFDVGVAAGDCNAVPFVEVLPRVQRPDQE